MLEIEYERSLNHNYMVISRDNNAFSGYKDEMLTQNYIEGILPVGIRRVNNKKLYCYDVSGSASFTAILENRKISGGYLKEILLSVLNTISNAGKYLLEENDFILLPEQIFLRVTETAARLCYLPEYNQDIRVQFQKLLEYFMNQIKYEEQETVVLVYSLYMKTKELNWSFADFKSILFEMNTVKNEMVNDKSLNREIKSFKNLEEIKEREVEKLYYPLKSYLFSGGMIFLVLLVFFISIQTKFIFKSFGTGIDVKKLLLLILPGTAVVIFAIRDSFSKKRMCSRMEMIEDKEKDNYERKDFYEESTDTVLLCDNHDSRRMLLIPARDTDYEKILLNEFPFFIGKLKLKADACIESPRVSKIHAKIDKEDNEFYLYDLNSTNGTFINGLRLPVNGRGMLRNGDLVSFADVDYIFSCPSS